MGIRSDWTNTGLSAALGIALPILQAPMAGGATTAELVAAVSRAGAFGSLAGATLAPEKIISEAARIRSLSGAPFGINLFVLEPPEVDPALAQQGMARLQPYYAELGMAAPALPARYCESVAAQIEAVLAVRPALLSFTFGIVGAEVVARLHGEGIKVMGTATNVAEALAWQAAGADFVCVQGAEAGGHRGTFIGPFEQSMIGLFALLPQVVDALDIPVVAAGAIMDGRGIAASLMLGAAGVQMGSAFLACDEAGIHPGWKARLAASAATDSTVTRVFSGRPARALVNGFVERMQAQADQVPAYPVQNALTAPLRAAAFKAGQLDYVSMYAGQGAPLARAMPAARLVERLREEVDALMARA